MNTSTIPSTGRTFFIFDVESIGLHGDGFAVAGGVFRDGSRASEFLFVCPPWIAGGWSSDRKWVSENVPVLPITHRYPCEIRAAFVNEWFSCEAAIPGLTMAVECGWPVEANFLSACARENANFQPYPVHEIATTLLMAGMDPLATYDRRADELPKHHPMADARQSARLLFEALRATTSR